VTRADSQERLTGLECRGRAEGAGVSAEVEPPIRHEPLLHGRSVADLGRVEAVACRRLYAVAAARHGTGWCAVDGARAVGCRGTSTLTPRA
jgi:hypothetical protein